MTTAVSIKPPRIQALARASAMIDVIADGEEAGVGLSVISKTTGLNKTTAFNLLASLVTLRLIEQDALPRPDAVLLAEATDLTLRRGHRGR